MSRFWNWVRDEAKGVDTLYISGPIDSEEWWDDAVTPKAFKKALDKVQGDFTLYINSPGGDVFAASSIYTMLIEHKGNITVKIDALAASAASVIAMAGTKVLMSPTAMLMIHDPATLAMGNKAEMEKAIAVLDEVKASIVNAYEAKTMLPRDEIEELMSAETWMNAYKAKELGFCDDIIETKAEQSREGSEEPAIPAGDGAVADRTDWSFSARAAQQRVVATAERFAGVKPVVKDAIITATEADEPPKDDKAEAILAKLDAILAAIDSGVKVGGKQDEEPEDPDESEEDEPEEEEPDEGGESEGDGDDGDDKDEEPEDRENPQGTPLADLLMELATLI